MKGFSLGQATALPANTTILERLASRKHLLILNVVMLNVVMLNVVASLDQPEKYISMHNKRSSLFCRCDIDEEGKIDDPDTWPNVIKLCTDVNYVFLY